MSTNTGDQDTTALSQQAVTLGYSLGWGGIFQGEGGGVEVGREKIEKGTVSSSSLESDR